ncbi:unnamed protein product [Owenia fusiformis]|uniref:Peptidase M13 N-terminal domain-containing protein n=1 Tax=Owenia fusiformis TaxID=6347 RepID=A0A8S4NWY9_OWEFU|nr:unnamed protein product [Owenia fusiformis]
MDKINLTELGKKKVIEVKGWQFNYREIVIFVCLCVSLIATLALTIVVATKGSSGNMTGGTDGQTGTVPPMADDVCMTPPCLESASYQLLDMNRSAHPCNDFYNFACGRWPMLSPLNPDESEVTPFTRMNGDNQEKLRRILESTDGHDPNWATGNKVKAIFGTCLNEYDKGLEGGNDLLDVIRDCGGWDVTGDWDAQSSNFLYAFEKVHIDYWTDALFQFRVGTDWYDTTKRIIEIVNGSKGSFLIEVTKGSVAAFEAAITAVSGEDFIL